MAFYLSLMSSLDLFLIINPLWMEWNIRFQFFIWVTFRFYKLTKVTTGYMPEIRIYHMYTSLLTLLFEKVLTLSKEDHLQNDLKRDLRVQYESYCMISLYENTVWRTPSLMSSGGSIALWENIIIQIWYIDSDHTVVKRLYVV